MFTIQTGLTIYGAVNQKSHMKAVVPPVTSRVHYWTRNKPQLNGCECAGSALEASGRFETNIKEPDERWGYV